jgi:hypothetical protein
MQLNPERALAVLQQAEKSYTQAKSGDRQEATRDLQQAINRAQIEISNLSQDLSDPGRRALYRQLTFHAELAAGELRQQTRAWR